MRAAVTGTFTPTFVKFTTGEREKEGGRKGGSEGGRERGEKGGRGGRDVEREKDERRRGGTYILEGLRYQAQRRCLLNCRRTVQLSTAVHL